MNRVEVTLQDIFWALKKYVLWIVTACVAGALIAFTYTQLFVTPVYSTQISMVVFASEREGTDVSSTQLTADFSLANTYTALMNSQPVCEAVSEAMGGKISASVISGMIKAVRISATQVINVDIQSGDPQLALEVGNALLEVAPQVLTEKAGGEMSAVNSATSAVIVSPNLRNNVLYGFTIGLVLSCAVVVLIAVLDTTIWREEDLERAYNIPVLGGVPSMIIDTGYSAKSSRR